MPSMMSSHGVALATAVVVSGTVVLLGFCRQRSPSSAQLDAHAGEEGFLSPPRSRGSPNSDAAGRRTGETAIKSAEEKKKNKRKKKVRFAEQLVELHVQEDDENGPTAEEKLFDVRHVSCRESEIGSATSHEMPANRTALYSGILRGRNFHMTRLTGWGVYLGLLSFSLGSRLVSFC